MNKVIWSKCVDFNGADESHWVTTLYLTDAEFEKLKKELEEEENEETCLITVVPSDDKLHAINKDLKFRTDFAYHRWSEEEFGKKRIRNKDIAKSYLITSTYNIMNHWDLEHDYVEDDTRGGSSVEHRIEEK
jgi:hypothetical protein